MWDLEQDRHRQLAGGIKITRANFAMVYQLGAREADRSPSSSCSRFSTRQRQARAFSNPKPDKAAPRAAQDADKGIGQFRVCGV